MRKQSVAAMVRTELPDAGVRKSWWKKWDRVAVVFGLAIALHSDVALEKIEKRLQDSPSGHAVTLHYNRHIGKGVASSIYEDHSADALNAAELRRVTAPGVSQFTRTGKASRE